MKYIDFDLEIGPGKEGVYPVAVRLPAGAVRGTMRFPFDKQTLELHLSKLDNALLRSRSGRRQVLRPQEEEIRTFGAALFDALVAGDVRAMYDQQHTRARQQGMGVRMRLLVEAPELATLPWEYLLDQRQPDFLGLSPKTPLVRYVKLPQPLEPLRVEPPLRILAMAASPSNLDELNIDGERERLGAALKPLEEQGIVKLRWVKGQTWQDLQGALWQRNWHIFHFIGHGAFNPQTDEGMLALSDEQGKAHLLPGSQLGRLLANAGLRVVVLNACEGAKGSEHDLFSSAGASLVRREIPAVVAMQAEISDGAALEFTRTFYRAIASGIPVDAALAEARTAIWISIPNTLEWGTPVLYLRAPDGVLFDVDLSRHSGTFVPPAASRPAQQTPPPRSTPQPAKQASAPQSAPASAPQQPVRTPQQPPLQGSGPSGPRVAQGGYLHLVRQSYWAGSLVAYQIFLDNHKIGGINNGGNETLEIPPGHHILYLRIPLGASSPPLSFDIAPGQTVTIMCQPTTFGQSIRLTRQ